MMHSPPTMQPTPSTSGFAGLPLRLLLLLYTLLALHPPPCDGHGYMMSPRSRNLFAHEEANWFDPSSSDPDPESCPQCLNLGGSRARCGITGSHNYDKPRNAMGGPMKTTVQAAYTQGQDIVIDVKLTAHHKGHFVFSGCPIDKGEMPTQECFDEHRLTFVADMLHGGKKDNKFPERAYIAPKPQNQEADILFSFKMRLPGNLVGDLVLIQWYYLTANTCSHEGYDEYDWPKNWGIDYIPDKCERIPKDGDGVPEQFWNCAEVKICKKGSSCKIEKNDKPSGNKPSDDKPKPSGGGGGGGGNRPSKNKPNSKPDRKPAKRPSKKRPNRSNKRDKEKDKRYKDKDRPPRRKKKNDGNRKKTSHSAKQSDRKKMKRNKLRGRIRHEMRTRYSPPEFGSNVE